MRIILVAMFAGLMTLPSLAQDRPPDRGPRLCAVDLRGVVKNGEHGRFLPGATVQILLGAEERVYRQTVTGVNGRFRLPIGRPRQGSEWVLRILGPGRTTGYATVTIDAQCAELSIPFIPGR